MQIQIQIRNYCGTLIPIDTYMLEMEQSIQALKSKVSMLEFKVNLLEGPDSDTETDKEKLKKEIIEEVNLIISDLL